MRRSCACNRQEIINKMRKLWSQHVYWTRFFIISTAEELPDLKYITNRPLENPGDFAKVLKIFYGEKKADEFKKLLTEHLQIAGDLVNADKDMNTAKADELRQNGMLMRTILQSFYQKPIRNILIKQKICLMKKCRTQQYSWT